MSFTANVVYNIYYIPYALTLLSACIFRNTICSLIYLFGFIAAVLFQPNGEYLQKRKTFAKIVPITMLLWSTLVLLSEGILGILVLVGVLDYSTTSPTAIQYYSQIIGFYWSDNVTTLQYIEMTLPEGVVWITSLVMEVLLLNLSTKKQPSSPSIAPISARELALAITSSSKSMSGMTSESVLDYIQKAREKQFYVYTSIHGYLVLFFCTFAGICYPSVLTLVYFSGSLATIVLLAFGFPIPLISKITWPFITLYTIFNMFYMLLCQFEFSGFDIAPIWLSGTDGPTSWIFGDWEWKNMWYIFLEYIFLIIIFYLMSIRFKVYSMKKNYKKAQLMGKIDRKELDASLKNLINKKFDAMPFLFLIKEFFSKHGWNLSFLFFILSCTVTPSYTQAILFIILLFGNTLIPARFFHFILPFILFYSVIFVFIQQFYNLPFNFPINTGSSHEWGLIKYDNPGFFIGIQIIPNFLLAIYWRNNEGIFDSIVKLAKRISSKEEDIETIYVEKALKISNTPKYYDGKTKQQEESKIFKTIEFFFKVIGKFMIEESYLLSLLAVFFCSLSQVNLFNFIYLVFFICLLFFSRQFAIRCWIILVLYSEFVVMCLYFYIIIKNLSVFQKTEPSMEGTIYETIGFGSSIWLNLLILIFSLFQNAIIRKFKLLQKKNLEQTKTLYSDLAERLPNWFLDLYHSMVNNIKNWSWVGCYLIFYLVGVLSRYDLISLFYISIIYICLIIHQAFDDAKLKIKVFWGFVVISTGAILITVYACQFDFINEALTSNWPSSLNQYLTLSDIGIEQLSGFDQYTQLFGASFVFILSVFQMSTFISQDSNNASLDHYPIVKFIANFFKRLLILHSVKITILVMFFTAITNVNAMGFIYLLLMIFRIFTMKFDFPGNYLLFLFIIVFSQLLSASQYLLEFNGINSLIQDTIFQNADVNETLEWIGFTSKDPNLFWRILWYNLLIASILLERFSSLWKKSDDIIKIKEKYGEIPLFLVTPKDFDLNENPNPFLHKTTIISFAKRSSWYLANLFNLYGLPLFATTLVFTIAVRENIWGVLEILMVFLIIVKPRIFRSLLSIEVIYFAIVLIFEYVFYLNLPPTIRTTLPWYPLDSNITSWLTLSDTYNIYTTFFDYSVLILGVLLLYSKEIRFEAPPRDPVTIKCSQHENIENIEMIDHSNGSDGDENKDHYNNGDNHDDDNNTMDSKFSEVSLLSSPSGLHLGNAEYFQKLTWQATVFNFLARYSMQIILFFIFLSATLQFDVLSFGYVLFSLVFMYKDRLLYVRRNQIWTIGRIYNFIVISIEVLYQAPIPYPTSNDIWNSLIDLIGIESYEGFTGVFQSGVYLDIIIFILMEIQKEIFDTTFFDTVNATLEHEKIHAAEIAKRRNDEFLQREKDAIALIELKKLQRKERLENVKLYRSQKLYLQSSANLMLDNQIRKKEEDMNYNNYLSDDQQMEDYNSENDTISLSLPLIPQGSNIENANNVNNNNSRSAQSSRHQSSDEDNDVKKDKKKAEISIVELDEKKEEKADDDDEENDDNEEEMIDKLIRYKNIAFNFVEKQIIERLYQYTIQYLYDRSRKKVNSEMTKLQVFSLGVYYWLLYQSDVACYLIFILNGIMYNNIIALVYPFLVFGFALMEPAPMPTRQFWRLMFFYTNLVIILKYVFQLSVFCVCYTPSDWAFWSVSLMCGTANDFCNPSFEIGISLMHDLPIFIGIDKLPDSSIFVIEVFFDLLVYVILLIHSNILRKTGLWIYLTTRKNEQLAQFIAKRKEEEKEKEIKKEEEKKKKEEKKKRKMEKKREKQEKKRQEKEKLLKLSQLNNYTDYLSDNSLEQLKEMEDTPSDADVDHLMFELTQTDDYDDSVNEKSLLLIEVDKNNELQRCEDGEDEEEDNNKEGMKEKVINTMNLIKYNLLFHVDQLFTHRATAKDYYVAYATVEVICWFFMILCQPAFTYNPSDTYTFFLLESRIPKSFFWIILVQFLLIVIDRVIYLFRSTVSKVIMQYFQLIYYFLLLFIILPQGSDKFFLQKPFLIAFFLLKCIYWWLSASQISDGFPLNIQSRFLTKSYSQVRYYIFQVYLMIPFLFELRTLLDWIITDTTLTFIHWLKLEDIYANLFIVKCKREKEKSVDFFQKQSKFDKIAMGLTVFIGLLVLLWAPLFLLSSANPSTRPNFINGMTIEIMIEGYEPPLYQITQHQYINPATPTEFDNIRSSNFTGIQSDDEAGTQIVTLIPYSDSLWQMTPPNLRQLGNSLVNCSATDTSYNLMQMRVTYTFNRTEPVNQQSLVTGTHLYPLSCDTRSQLYSIISNDDQISQVVIPALLPNFFRIPLDGIITTPNSPSSNLDIKFTLNKTITEERVQKETGNSSIAEVYSIFWYLENANTNQTYINNGDEPSYFPQLIVISAELPSFISASLAASGIIGLYITIVLVVGQFLRSSVTGLQAKIIYIDLPDPINLITMCEDIFTAREDLDLVLERELYNELIEIYRSPETIMEMTKLKRD